MVKFCERVEIQNEIRWLCCMSAAGLGVRLGGDWSKLVLCGKTAIHATVSDAERWWLDAVARQRRQRPLLVPFPRCVPVGRRDRLRAGAGSHWRHGGAGRGRHRAGQGGGGSAAVVARSAERGSMVQHLVRHLWRRVAVTTTTTAVSSSSFARPDFWWGAENARL